MSDGRTGTAGRVGAAIVVVVAIIAAIVLLGQDSRDEPYDLRSARGGGTRILKLLLNEYGHDVRVVEPDDTEGVGTLIVPTPESASDHEVRAWREFARRGGTLILAGPVKAGLGAHAVSNFDDVGLWDTFAEMTCDVPSLEGLERADFASRVTPLEVRSGDLSCFGNGESAALISTSEGDGRVITLGSGSWLTNGTLRFSDAMTPTADDYSDAATALVILASDNPDPDVGYVRPYFTPTEPRLASLTFWSFVRPSVKAGLLELLVAVGLFAWWRARRLGRVVSDPVPVEIAGSELVDAVGDMMRRRHDPGAAATLVRSHAIAELGEACGLGKLADKEMLVQRLAAATGRTSAEVALLLFSGPVSTSDELIALISTIDSLRTEVSNGVRSTR